MMRVLVIRVGAIGDTILLSPVLQNLRSLYPGAEIHVLGHPERVRLLDGPPNADESISSEDPRWLDLYRNRPENPETVRWLTGYNLVISYSARSGGILERNLRETVRGRLILHPALPPEGFGNHYVEFLLEPLLTLGPPRPTPYPVVSWAGRRGKDTFNRRGSPGVIIHPGAGNRAKRWPLERFLTIASSLTREARARCCFLLGPAEKGLETEIMGAGVETCTGSDLGKAVALLRGANGYVGNDSGITHLAAALGIPTVAIFTATDPGIWGPIGRHVKVFDQRDPKQTRQAVESVTCFLVAHLH